MGFPARITGIYMSRVVKIGSLRIGGKNPVRIQGMLKAALRDRKILAQEARQLEKEGAEVLRVAVREKSDVKIAGFLKQHIALPLVADVHFHPELALLAIEAGFEGIRLNPLNIVNKQDVRQIAKSAKARGISIRVGVNSGGFKKRFASPRALAVRMAAVARQYLRLLEEEGFFDIMVSLKGSDVASTLIANKAFAETSAYPLHLGVTATGPFLDGLVKSAIGLGSLLYAGIGSIIRISLTAPSIQEIRAARSILSALKLRRFGPEIIACPTCSRCEVDLISIVERFRKDIDSRKLKRLISVAIMGCVVNGPGEALQADLGVAFGRKQAVIFKKGKILRRSSAGRIIPDLKEEIKKYELK